jgi:hypothetical protein
MMNITAQITVEHGSRCNPVAVPFETLLLDESGPVPVWILKEQNIKWKVTPSNKFEDALLMASLMILKDPELEEFVCDYFSHLDEFFFDNVDLNVSFSAEDLQLLYQKNREICSWKRLIINVLDGCSDADFQIQALEDYTMNLEVCITTYRRISHCGEKLEISGHEDFYYC